MSEETKLALRADKCSSIIRTISKLYGVSLEDAMDIFYKSETALLIEEGVADLHCRSDKYLATIVWEEAQETQGKTRANIPSTATDKVSPA